MKTRQIKIGNVKIGANNPIAIQSMTNTLTKDAFSTIEQIKQLQEAGCEIIRVAVPDKESVSALKEIKNNINIPLAADIHFDHKLAIESAKYADKIRINPGNIGNKEKIKQIIKAAKKNSIPIRIGVNLASIEKDLESKYGLTPKAMVASALRHINFFEDNNFYDIVVSLKASDVKKTIEANRLFSSLKDYPMHLGITESGTIFSGTISSSIGIGSLLLEGIGSTIRVSLSAEPIEEIKVAKQILSSLNLRKFGVKITACPTCARANFDVSRVAKELEEKTINLKKPMTIAVMGCSVNGPGEAKEAELGIVGGKGENLIYEKGKISGKVSNKDITNELLRKIKQKE